MLRSMLDLASSVAESVSDTAAEVTKFASDLGAEVDRKVDRIPAELNEYGYDPWGYSPKAMKRFILPAAFLYRYYFRCITTGLENLPEEDLNITLPYKHQLDSLFNLTLPQTTEQKK